MPPGCQTAADPSSFMYNGKTFLGHRVYKLLPCPLTEDTRALGASQSQK